MSKIPYASIVDSIIYAMIYTRPNVAYSLEIVSRYQSNLEENHWKIVKIILKYLRNTKDQWLVYEKYDMKLVGFIDSSFQSDHDNNNSVSDFVFILNSEVIYWKSFKQHTMIDSVCQIEYIATSNAAKEAVWLRKFIDELRVASSLDGLVLLYCDSIGAITQAKKPKSHQRIKYIRTATTWSKRSWIEVTSSFKKLIERRTRPTHLLKSSISKSLKIIK